MDRNGRTAFGVFACAVWAYVIARAMLVPPVHDECASLLWFVRSGDWLPYLAHWDANDHYLSTGIGLLSTRTFGESLIALRAGSVLAFVCYAWAARRISANVSARVARACLWAALLLCPFLLDFFSLFRGYAIEMAGWLMALDGLLRYAATSATRQLVQVLIGVLLASVSIVALLPASVLVLLLVPVLMWRARRTLPARTLGVQVAALAFGGMLPLAGLSLVALELKARGLLYHGSTDGFFEVTVMSLCHYVSGTSSIVVGYMVVAVLLFSGVLAVRELVRTRSLVHPLVLINALLWGDVALRVFLARAFGVNYPEDRASLHFIPLALLSFAFAVNEWAQDRPRAIWATTALLLLPARSAWTANVDHTAAWPEQSVPVRFIDRVEASSVAAHRPLLVGAQHQLALAWPVGVWLSGHRSIPLQTEGFPDGPHDMRIVDKRFLREASAGYHTVDSAAGPGLWLLERDRSLDVRTTDVLHAAERSTREEFAELAHLPDSLLRAESVLVQVNVPLIVPSRSPDVRLVVEVNDEEGGKLLYDAVAPLALRPDWVGYPMRWAWGLPAMPRARRAVVYLYNPGKCVVSHGEARIRLSAIR